MRILLCVLLIVIELASLGAANCGDSGQEEKVQSSEGSNEVSKATSPAPPRPEEMESFDGSVAPSVVELKPTRYAVFKGTLADPKTAWETMIAQAGPMGLMNDEARAWSILPSMPTSSTELDPATPYWPAFTIKDELNPEGELTAYTSPGGKYAMAAHRGPYEKLAETWGRFAGFIFHNANVDMARPALEHYYSDPGTTPPDDLITLLYIPID